MEKYLNKELVYKEISKLFNKKIPKTDQELFIALDKIPEAMVSDYSNIVKMHQDSIRLAFQGAYLITRGKKNLSQFAMDIYIEALNDITQNYYILPIDTAKKMHLMDAQWITHKINNKISSRECPVCGEYVKKASNFCRTCGTRMTGSVYRNDDGRI